MTQSALASAIGTKQSTVQNWLGGADPSREYVVLAARALDVSLEWLASGRGEMDWRMAAGPAMPLYPNEAEGEMVALPRYSVEAAAGGGSLVVSEDVVDLIHFRRSWLRTELGINPGRLAIITAAGDSMAPTIESGDLLMVDLGDRQLRADGVYVLRVSDVVVVKRISVKPSGVISVVSDNPLYKHTAEDVAHADSGALHVVGRVVWVGGRI